MFAILAVVLSVAVRVLISVLRAHIVTAITAAVGLQSVGIDRVEVGCVCRVLNLRNVRRGLFAELLTVKVNAFEEGMPFNLIGAFLAESGLRTAA